MNNINDDRLAVQNYLKDSTVDQVRRDTALSYLKTSGDTTGVATKLRTTYGSRYDGVPKDTMTSTGQSQQPNWFQKGVAGVKEKIVQPALKAVGETAGEGIKQIGNAFNEAKPKGDSFAENVAAGLHGGTEAILGAGKVLLSPFSALSPTTEKMAQGASDIAKGTIGEEAFNKGMQGVNKDILQPTKELFDKLPQGWQDALKLGGLGANFLGAGEAGTALKSGAEMAGKALKDVPGIAGKVVETAAQLPEGAVSLAEQGIKGAKEIPGVLSEARKARIINNRTEELTKLQANNGPLRKTIASAESKGIDVKGELAKSDLLHQSVDNTGTIRTEEAIGKLNDFIRPQEDVVSRTLKAEGKTISLNQVRNDLVKAVEDSGVKGGAKIRALNTVDQEIAGYKLEAKDSSGKLWNDKLSEGEPMIDVSTVHDAKVDKYGNINYENPESAKVDKAIAKGLKQIVEKNSTADTGALNKELSKWYAVQSLLEKLNGKKVEGGRLMKSFNKIIGGMVGSHFGIPGTIAGAKAGEFLTGANMARKFGGKIGTELEQSALMKDALSSVAEKEAQSQGGSTINQTARNMSPKGENIDLTPAKANVNASAQTNIVREDIKKGVKEYPNPDVIPEETAPPGFYEDFKKPGQAGSTTGTSKIIDPDVIKKTYKGYTEERAPEFHEQSSKDALIQLDTELQKPEYDKLEIVTGGPGSGKSEKYVKANSKDPSKIIFDYTGSSAESIQKRIDLAKKYGKEVKVVGVITDPEQAWKYKIQRPRNVPRSVFIDNTSGNREALYNLAQNNPDLKMDLYINTKDVPLNKVEFSNKTEQLDFLKSKQVSKPSLENMINQSVSNKSYDTTIKSGGSTLNLNEYTPKKGYAFAPSKKTELQIPKESFSRKDVLDYLLKHKSSLSSENNYLGVWEKDGKIYLDVSTVHHERDTALNLARKSKQEAVYNLETGEDIPVPK